MFGQLLPGENACKSWQPLEENFLLVALVVVTTTVDLFAKSILRAAVFFIAGGINVGLLLGLFGLFPGLLDRKLIVARREQRGAATGLTRSGRGWHLRVGNVVTL